MGHTGHGRLIDTHADRNAAKGIEELDGQRKFLVEELEGVRHRRTAAGEKDPHRRGTFLGRPVERDGTRNLVVDTRHDRAGNFPHFGDFLVLGAGIVAGRRDESLDALEFLDLAEAALLELFVQGGRDGIAADGQGADEDILSFDKDQVGGSRADVDQQ